jgi:hypothetical protein
MIAYAAAVIPLLRRMRAVKAAALSLSAWLVVAAVAALPLLLA